MHIGINDHHFEWIDTWADLADDERLRTGWAHHALGVTREGQIVGFHPADGQVIILTADGTVARRLDCGVVEGHGVTIVEEGGLEYLWIADNGRKAVHNPSAPYGYELYVPDPPGSKTATRLEGTETGTPVPRGRVLKVRLDDGEVVCVLPTPSHVLYDDRPYIPTAAVVGPDETIWVADGYGASLLHHFAPDGRLIRTLTGEESDAGRFNCPHGLLVDRRRDEPELYVADRENHRILVFSLDGAFRRQVARGELARPCALATHGSLLAVAELRARIALLDIDDQVIGYLGDNGVVVDTPGWPNSIVDGKLVRQEVLTPGKFNSPHGLAVDGDGNLYVAEWLIGGRYTKLKAVPR